MICEEFRSQYNVWLDRRKSAPLPPEVELHARTCRECETYSRAMLLLDAGLQRIPDVPVPEEIRAYSGERGTRAPGRGRVLLHRLRSGAVLGLPPVAVWSVSAFIPPPWNFAVQFLLVSGAIFLFAVASLRPRFIA
jgi:hypothetical protein